MPRRTKAQIEADERDARLNSRLQAIMSRTYEDGRRVNGRSHPDGDTGPDDLAGGAPAAEPGIADPEPGSFGFSDGADAAGAGDTFRRQLADGTLNLDLGADTPGLAPSVESSDSPVSEARADVPRQDSVARPHGVLAFPSPAEQQERAAPEEPPKRRRRKGVTETAASVAQEAAGATVSGIRSLLPRPVNDGAGKIKQSEIDDIRQRYIKAWRDYFQYADAMIDATTGGGKKQISIWGNMTDAEMGLFVDARLRRAMHSDKAGKSVRRAISYHEDVIGPALVVLPRMVLTFQAYMEHGVDLSGGMGKRGRSAN